MRVDNKGATVHETIAELLEKAKCSDALSREQAERLPQLLTTELLDIMASARLAASTGGSKHFTCAIVNAKSGRCQENCAFCAQSAHHETNVRAYPLLSSDELLAQAEKYAGAGVDYMGLVTSGTGPNAVDFECVCRTAEKIRANVDIRLCASFGILNADMAKQLRASGFTSCHHNLETSRSHYPSVCTTHGYELRVDTVKQALASGLRVCSGGIFGVGESWEQRIELSMELAELGVHSIPINFLMPIPGTPMAKARSLSPREALATIALFRLMHPHRDIVVCGGRASLGRYVEMLFSAGANGLMVGDYLTTKGDALREDMDMITMLGLKR